MKCKKGKYLFGMVGGSHYDGDTYEFQKRFFYQGDVYIYMFIYIHI